MKYGTLARIAARRTAALKYIQIPFATTTSNRLMLLANQRSRRREYPNLPHLAGPIAFILIFEALNHAAFGSSMQVISTVCPTITPWTARFFTPSTGPPHAGSIVRITCKMFISVLASLGGVAGNRHVRCEELFEEG